MSIQDGKVEVIANEEGGKLSLQAGKYCCTQGADVLEIDRQIPSILSYIDGEEYHGTQAKAQLVRNSQNTVTNFRDYLGKE